ncbi:MAG: META domain-containing protein [Bacteroidetes bacterium]|nr:META domain-containing protein [Bacteroidota bacterium]
MKKYLTIIISAFILSSNAQPVLKDVTWVLLKIEDKAAKTCLTISHDHSVLLFEDSTYAGYGCDAFSGRYKINGNKINFIGGMSITNAGCSNPEDYTAEDYIMKNFIQLEYKIVDDNLILNKDDNVIFTFVKRAKKKKGNKHNKHNK